MEPLEVLRAFWADMCEWERGALQLTRSSRPTAPEVVARLVAEREAIVARYCTPKPRVYSQPFSCGEPTVYDPAIEDELDLVEESPRRVVVHTQQRAGFKDRRRYVMLRRGDRWLLDSWQRMNGGKWERGII